MKIYVASSWRCPFQQGAVEMLRESGVQAYDFRNPAAAFISVVTRLRKRRADVAPAPVDLVARIWSMSTA